MYFENELISISDCKVDAFVHNNLNYNVNVDLHWHECFELLYVIEGETLINLNNIEFTAKVGDLIIVKKGDIHSTICKKGENVKMVVVKFLPSFVEYMFPTGYDSAYITSFLNMRISPFKNLNGNEYQKKIVNTFHMIVDEYTEKRKGFETSLKGLLAVLINDIIRLGLLEYGNDEFLIKEKTRNDISKLLRLIEDNASDRSFSLKDLANHAHFNYSYCSRYFKKHTGKGFLEFLNFVRVCESEKMIMEKDYNITQIATMCGFSDASAFSKTYKKIRGYSPSLLKKVKY